MARAAAHPAAPRGQGTWDPPRRKSRGRAFVDLICLFPAKAAADRVLNLPSRQTRVSGAHGLSAGSPTICAASASIARLVAGVSSADAIVCFGSALIPNALAHLQSCQTLAPPRNGDSHLTMRFSPAYGHFLREHRTVSLRFLNSRCVNSSALSLPLGCLATSSIAYF